MTKAGPDSAAAASAAIPHPSPDSGVTSADAVGRQLFEAIERGDIDAVRALYSPDIAVWHNFDEIEQDAEANLTVLAWCIRHIEGMRYEDVRRVPIPGGFVQQHVMRGRSRSGSEIRVPACMVVDVADGKITRIEEYLDPGQVSALA
ncbi:MAG: nuclear transport factor 2 family protein [Acidimicrobiales bacterium]